MLIMMMIIIMKNIQEDGLDGDGCDVSKGNIKYNNDVAPFSCVSGGMHKVY